MLRTVALSMLIVLPLIGGCAGGSNRAQTQAAAPVSNTDPCATRLHDIAGAMLLYLAQNDDLPMDLSELPTLAGSSEQDDPDRFVCPVSRQSYIYTPDGFLLPEKDARIVLFDPAPSHAGMRWGLSVTEPQPNVPVVIKVIALPESLFLLRPPAAPAPLPPPVDEPAG